MHWHVEHWYGRDSDDDSIPIALPVTWGPDGDESGSILSHSL